MKETLGTIKVLKNQEYDKFGIEEIRGFENQRVFFWGLTKNY